MNMTPWEIFEEDGRRFIRATFTLARGIELGRDSTLGAYTYIGMDDEPVERPPQPREPRDIVDEIDALVEDQLSNYQNRSGYDYNVNQDKCWHCGRDWHGLPITEKIAQMYSRRTYDEGYSLAEDDSRVVCEGSNFNGPTAAPLATLMVNDGHGYVWPQYTIGVQEAAPWVFTGMNEALSVLTMEAQ